jgi:hypothetical protein
VAPIGLALVFLPLWPGGSGLAGLALRAARDGRSSKLGLLLEMGSMLASSDPTERWLAIRALWFFAYFILLCGAWIAYAAMLGI